MPNKLKIIFCLTLFLILGSFQQCYALQNANTFTGNDVEKIIDYIYQSNYYTEFTEEFYNYVKSKDFNNVANTINSNIDITKIPYMENIAFSMRFTEYSTEVYNIELVISSSNNTIGNIAPFVSINESTNNENYKIDIRFVDAEPNETPVSVNSYYLRVQWRTNGNFRTYTTASGYPGLTYVNSQVEIKSQTLAKTQLVSLNVPAHYYIKTYDSSAYNWYIDPYNIIYTDEYIANNPEEPSGDTSGDSGSSGDIGGDSEIGNKLDNIQGSLNNIENKIPTSGDIQNSITEGNKDFWGEPSGEELKKEQEENIESIKEQLTESLENNEIMGALHVAEQGFIEILQGEARRFQDFLARC